eukprot:m.248776 g.248776  ORF g.248776 m.248776 type:complete len:130 (+) comp15872_c0_seq10:93-482(+)
MEIPENECSEPSTSNGDGIMDGIIASVRDELVAAKKMSQEASAANEAEPTERARSVSPTARWGTTVSKRKAKPTALVASELTGMRGVNAFNQSDLESRIAQQIDEKIAIQVESCATVTAVVAFDVTRPH